MSTAIAQNSDNEIGCSVDDLGMVGEVFGGIDEASQPDAAGEPAQVPLYGPIDLSEQIHGTKARGRLPVLDRYISSELADVLIDAVTHGYLPRHVKQIPDFFDRQEIRAGFGCGLRQFDAQFAQAVFQAVTHLASPNQSARTTFD